MTVTLFLFKIRLGPAFAVRFPTSATTYHTIPNHFLYWEASLCYLSSHCTSIQYTVSLYLRNSTFSTIPFDIHCYTILTKPYTQNIFLRVDDVRVKLVKVVTLIAAIMRACSIFLYCFLIFLGVRKHGR